ncbi:hypothetical protein ILUMI_01054 [Ignelater luminosus]|uniref:Platelet-derived growth factor (PDGF) family profile domain-containing protein n=1 Tax=Ignelater luminosus TaxID=2038154 RepID=A0A8K0DKF3_IGNLU|nr:hypothetical protein ILUMI_01054 [Ignelater luminosus]
MQSFSCMLCKKDDREFINICYKNGRNSAKDDILELCGHSVEQYLETDDLVCYTCTKVLDNAAELKRQIYEIIIEHASNRKPPNNKNIKNNLHTTRSDYEESPDDDCSSNSSATPSKFVNLSTSPQNFLNKSMSPRNYIVTSSPRTRGSPHNYLGTSPNNLLVIKHSIPFDERSDTDMEEANNKYRNTPALDREVQQANFLGRRKTRGHNWTRRKGSQKSRSRSRGRSSHSRQSRVSRTLSRLSRGTTASKKHHIQKQAETLQKTRILSDFLYQNDALSQFTRAYLSKTGEIVDEDTSYECDWNESVTKPVVKTRYASDLRDKLLAEYEEYIYECPVNSCQQILLSLEQITEHRVKEHNEMALFWCEQCKFSYLSQKRDKDYSQTSDNEIYQKTNIITVKFPKIEFPSNSTKMEPNITRRRINTNVQPVEENCQTKTFRTELNQLRQKIKCEPRDTVVDLVSAFGDIITPNAVVVKRCGGMCTGTKRCLPSQKKDVKFYVRTIRDNQMYCSSIIVSEDTKCKCGCQQKPSDCTENQVYNRERCACICRNEKDYTQCVENPNENFHWDERTCSCVCHQSKSCTTGTYWVENECRCSKMSP